MNEKRTLFGKPTRYTTLEFFPEKLTVKEFCDHIRGSIDGFEKNLSDPKFSTYRYIEEWFETMGAWMEIEEERE